MKYEIRSRGLLWGFFRGIFGDCVGDYLGCFVWFGNCAFGFPSLIGGSSLFLFLDEKKQKSRLSNLWLKLLQMGAQTEPLRFAPLLQFASSPILHNFLTPNLLRPSLRYGSAKSFKNLSLNSKFLRSELLGGSAGFGDCAFGFPSLIGETWPSVFFRKCLFFFKGTQACFAGLLERKVTKSSRLSNLWLKKLSSGAQSGAVAFHFTSSLCSFTIPSHFFHAKSSEAGLLGCSASVFGFSAQGLPSLIGGSSLFLFLDEKKQKSRLSNLWLEALSWIEELFVNLKLFGNYAFGLPTLMSGQTLVLCLQLQRTKKPRLQNLWLKMYRYGAQSGAVAFHFTSSFCSFTIPSHFFHAKSSEAGLLGYSAGVFGFSAQCFPSLIGGTWPSHFFHKFLLYFKETQACFAGFLDKKVTKKSRLTNLWLEALSWIEELFVNLKLFGNYAFGFPALMSGQTLVLFSLMKKERKKSRLSNLWRERLRIGAQSEAIALRSTSTLCFFTNPLSFFNAKSSEADLLNGSAIFVKNNFFMPNLLRLDLRYGSAFLRKSYFKVSSFLRSELLNGSANAPKEKVFIGCDVSYRQHDGGVILEIQPV